MMKMSLSTRQVALLLESQQLKLRLAETRQALLQALQTVNPSDMLSVMIESSVTLERR